MLYRRADTYPGGAKALALDMGVSDSTISNWKYAVRGDNMSPDHVVLLARLLGMSTDQLLGVVTPGPDLNALSGWIDEVIGAADELSARLVRARAMIEAALSGRALQEQGDGSR